MRFRLEQHFPHSREQVEAAFVDPDFLTHLGELPKLGRPELLDQHSDGDIVRQRIRYRFVGELSPAVTAVIDRERLTWVEESTLDRRVHRTVHVIHPDHYANRLECTYITQLSQDGQSFSRRTAEGDVKVRFPLVGGKVERAIVSGLAEHAEVEAEVLRRWLADAGD